jgi:uncharacterized integral membrane protein (TIGR00697 family)
MDRREKIYTILCALFTVILVVSNLILRKWIELPILPFYMIILPGGALLYPFTFLLLSLIIELYGKERACFCLRFAIAVNVLVEFIVIMIDSLPASLELKYNREVFHKAFQLNTVSFISSLVACYLSQRVNISLYLRIRKVTKRKWLGLRYIMGTFISSVIDTSVFISLLMFSKRWDAERLWFLLKNTYSYKLFFIVTITPLFYLSWHILRFLMRKRYSSFYLF